MPTTPITPIRIPENIKKEILRRKGNKTLTAWVIGLILEEFKK